MRPWSVYDRLLAACLCVAIATLSTGLRCGGGGGAAPLPPSPGLPLYQEALALPIGPLTVNLAGGNLMVRRLDLSLDTRVVRPFELRATWNSATGEWTRSFDMRYDGELFVDATGAEYDVSGVADGARIPGSAWVKLDALRLKTLGGLVHRFDPGDHLLRVVHWSTADFPRLEIQRAAASPHRAETLVQCRAPGDCGELVASFSRDAQDRYTAIADRAGRLATFSYDAQGRLQDARDGADVEKSWPGFRYDYDAQGRIAAVTDSEGERVELVWRGRAVREIRPIGPGDPVYRFQLGRSGGTYWSQVEEPRGYTSAVDYDAQGRVLRISDGNGDSESVSWDGFEMASRTDRAGLLTAWSMPDANTRVETRPSGDVVVTSYADVASPLADRDHPRERPVVTVADSLGAVELRSYDPAGRLVAVTDGAGDTISYSYDAEENLASVVLPSGQTAVELSSYGEHGRPEILFYPDTQHTEVREYDAVGNQLSGWNASRPLDPGRGGILRRGYDADRNLVRLDLRPTTAAEVGIPPAPEVLAIERRSDGRVTSISRPYGGDTEFVYDALGRPVERRDRVDGEWVSTTAEFDAAGNLVAVEWPNGMRREATFGAGGELLELRFLRDGAPEQVVSYAYDRGRLVSKVDSSYGGSPEVLVYDAAGRVAEHHFPRSDVLFQSYDARGRLGAQRFELDGETLRELTYAYDAADRRVVVRDDGETILDKEFEGSRIQRIRYGNGLERSFAYEGPNLVGSTTAKGAVEVESTEVSYEDCGGAFFFCHTAVTTTIGSAAATTSEVLYLAPTPQESASAGPRAIVWVPEISEEPWGTGGFIYDYDALGNLTRRPGPAPGGPSDFSFNAEHNRLLSGSGHSYVYDAAGFVVERDGEALHWMASGRIASIGDWALFAWDAEGRPVATSIAGVGGALHLFGGLVQADLEGSPRSLSVGNEVEIRLDGGGRLYRHFDYRGNVKFVSDDAGDVVAHYQYSAYRVEASFGGEPEARSFAQGRELGTSGLVWLGARIYDPDVGRFLSPDPVFQVVNQYSYTLGNPLWFWDPSGAAAESADAAAAGTSELGQGLLNDILYGALLLGLGIGLLIAGLVVLAIVIFSPPSGPAPPPGPPGPNPPAPPDPSAQAGAGTGSGLSCSPTALGALPGLGGLLAVLLPLTALLGLALLLTRREPTGLAVVLGGLAGPVRQRRALAVAAGVLALLVAALLATGAVPWPF